MPIASLPQDTSGRQTSRDCAAASLLRRRRQSGRLLREAGRGVAIGGPPSPARARGSPRADPQTPGPWQAVAVAHCTKDDRVGGTLQKPGRCPGRKVHLHSPFRTGGGGGEPGPAGGRLLLEVAAPGAAPRLIG